jgi:hypothetical protein
VLLPEPDSPVSARVSSAIAMLVPLRIARCIWTGGN